MTVIAWDGHRLAGDKRGNSGGCIFTSRKIYRFRDCLVGFIGSADRVGALMEWIRGGCEPTKYPANPIDDNCFMLMVCRDGRILRYEDTPWPIAIEDKKYAMGSGGDAARAAMHLGCSAQKAVEIAFLFDLCCGDGVDVLSFEEEE